MNDLATLLATNLAVVAGMMLALWLVSLALRDASVVDPFWGLGFSSCPGSASLRADSQAPPAR